MIYRVYSIYDRKALIYYPPFFAATNGQAVRTFTDTANDQNSSIARHPNDYVLFCIGDYNDQNGKLTPLMALEHVIDASVIVQALQSEIPFPELAHEDGTIKSRGN